MSAVLNCRNLKKYIHKMQTQKKKNTFLAVSAKSDIPKSQNTTFVVQNIIHANISQTVNLVELVKNIKSETNMNDKIYLPPVTGESGGTPHPPYALKILLLICPPKMC